MSRDTKKPVEYKILGAVGGVLVLPLLIPLVVVVLVLHFAYHAALYLLVWLLWLPKGKDTLFVYSDSPIWREYMLNEVLPLVQERAIVLNCSHRRVWKKWNLATLAFHAVKGDKSYNPMVVVFRPFRRAQRFRFWTAFQEWKHGNKASVDVVKSDLLQTL